MKPCTVDTDMDILINIIKGWSKNAIANKSVNFNETEAFNKSKEVNVIKEVTNWCLNNSFCQF